MTTATDPALALLGAAAPSEPEFTELVRSITGDPAAVPGEVQVVPVDYPIGTPSTHALLRVYGGQWSCFVKLLQSARHWPLLHLIPEPARDSLVENVPWSLEAAALRSDLAELLPAGMRLPRVYRIDEYGDDRAALWMENVNQVMGPWPLDRFERAAYLLGRLSARRQPDLVEPLLDRKGARTPGAALRYYTNGRVLWSVVPMLTDSSTWQEPALAEAIAATGNQTLQADLLALAERVPAVLDKLDTMPQCYQHGDASPQNLLVPQENEDEFVVIDWGFDCPQAVGFDLGQLLVGLAHAGELAPSALHAVHKVIVPAFMAGLAEDGLHVPEQDVLYGYLGSLLCRATFTALPLQEPAPPGFMEQRVELTRALVDLVSPDCLTTR